MGEPNPTSPLPPLSVVVTTYNRADQLPAMLATVLADPAATEIVVVCDASPDDTATVLAELAEREPRIVPVLLERNVGQPRARWSGVQAARHERVLSLDDDVHLDPGCVTGHAGQARSADVIVGYMPTPAPPAWLSPSTFFYSESYQLRCAEWEAGQSVLENFWAGNFSFNRSDFLRATEGFDFSVRYHEDQDLGLRLATLGLHGVFDRNLSATHRFVRPFAASLRDSFAAGVGTAAVADLHGRSNVPDLMAHNLRSAAPHRRFLLELALRPVWHERLLQVLSGVVAVGGTLRSSDLTLRAARLAWEMAYLKGLSTARSPGAARF